MKFGVLCKYNSKTHLMHFYFIHLKSYKVHCNNTIIYSTNPKMKFL